MLLDLHSSVLSLHTSGLDCWYHLVWDCHSFVQKLTQCLPLVWWASRTALEAGSSGLTNWVGSSLRACIGTVGIVRCGEQSSLVMASIRKVLHVLNFCGSARSLRQFSFFYFSRNCLCVFFLNQMFKFVSTKLSVFVSFWCSQNLCVAPPHSISVPKFGFTPLLKAPLANV